MFTLARLVEFAKQFGSGGPGNSLNNELYEGLALDAVQETWNARRWPFAVGELQITTIAPYTTGTVAVTNNSATVTLTTGTWSTSWPTPALIYIEDDPNEYLVSSFDTTTTLTVDEPITRTTGSGLSYSVYFPSYTLPSDFLSIQKPQRAQWPFEIDPISYEDWMELRAGMLITGPLSRYAIVPTDGNTDPKIYMWPAPTVAEVIRAQYHKAVTRGIVYRTGTASITNGATALTGSGTLWATTSTSLAGYILEFHDTAPGFTGTLPSSGLADTAITLTANWGGPTQAAKAYTISPRINMPDLVLPAIRELMKVKSSELRRDYDGIAFWQSKFQRELNRAWGMLWPHGTRLERAEAADECDPAMEQKKISVPRMIVVET